MPGTFVNSYTYDAGSNRIGFTAPDGSTNTYSYDTLNRQSTLSNSWAGSFGFSYDNLNHRTQMTRPNNVTTSYTYDRLSRLLSVLHQAGGGILDGASYSPDNAGNRVAKTDLLASATTDYGYDAIYELLSAAGESSANYTYDSVGNRLSSLAGSSSYNSSNELTASPSASYTYDANGNTTKCITKVMLVTACTGYGPGSDWPHFAPSRKGGRPKSVGPGTVAVANSDRQPYAYGSTVTVSGVPGYTGTVWDTGAGWDPDHHNVPADDWIDIWLPTRRAAMKWGMKWREVTICDDKCKK